MLKDLPLEKQKEHEKARRKKYYDENKDRINALKRARRELNHEEELKRQREYKDKNREKVNEWARNQYWKDPERGREKALEYLQENREKVKERSRERYAQNPEKYRSKRKEYYCENAESERQKAIERYHDNIDEMRKRASEYRKAHLEECLRRDREYKKNNKEELRVKGKVWYWKRVKVKGQEKERVLFEKILSILGDECIVCGTKDRDILTIDHIKDDGNTERKEQNFRGRSKLLKSLEKKNWPEDFIKENYQILCYSHNCAKNSRDYFDKPIEELDKYQKRYIRVWGEAFDFFGPCERCGEKDKKYLCLDHRNGDGYKDRRSGTRKTGIKLIDEFRKMGWPQELKKRYRILCWNCNMKTYMEKLRVEENIKYFFHCSFI